MRLTQRLGRIERPEIISPSFIAAGAYTPDLVLFFQGTSVRSLDRVLSLISFRAPENEL